MEDEDKNGENASNEETSSDNMMKSLGKDGTKENTKELDSKLTITETSLAIKHPLQTNTNDEPEQTKDESETDSKFLDGPSCSKLVAAANFERKPPITIEQLDEKPDTTAQTKNSKSSGKKSRNSKSSSKGKQPEIKAESQQQPQPQLQPQTETETETDPDVRQVENGNVIESNNADPTPVSSVRSIGGLVCRICHNAENPERLVSPCLCKGSLSFVHIHCLERWISTSRSTICELCQFQYNTEQTLRYTCLQSLRLWYSRSMSRRALQEDCQMFSLLTLVAFGIIGTLLVGIQYYFVQGRHWGLSSVWTKGWLLFFLFTTLLVYFINIYMILRSQLAPWYRWWQSARDIKLILENRKPFRILPGRRIQRIQRQTSQATPARQQIAQQRSQGQPAPAPAPTPAPTPAVIRLATMPAFPPAISPLASKLQMASELTSTAAEIIEIPLEEFDNCNCTLCSNPVNV